MPVPQVRMVAKGILKEFCRLRISLGENPFILMYPLKWKILTPLFMVFIIKERIWDELPIVYHIVSIWV